MHNVLLATVESLNKTKANDLVHLGNESVTVAKKRIEILQKAEEDLLQAQLGNYKTFLAISAGLTLTFVALLLAACITGIFFRMTTVTIVSGFFSIVAKISSFFVHRHVKRIGTSIEASISNLSNLHSLLAVIDAIPLITDVAKRDDAYLSFLSLLGKGSRARSE